VIQGIMFDMKALVYGPTGADFLSEVLQAEGIAAASDDVAQALTRLPHELEVLRSNMRDEEQENEYNRAMLPALLSQLGLETPSDALLFRLVETVYEYSAYYSMYPEILPVLQSLKERGLKLVVVANWEPSLHRMVAAFELGEFLTTIVSSSVVGAAKPDGFFFHRALKQAGLKADEVLHVGPSMQEDVAGASAAGIRPVWLNRLEIPTNHDVLSILDLRGLLLLLPQEAD
jgi:HAD superfamily hydrolase (TIGR01549 family)